MLSNVDEVKDIYHYKSHVDWAADCDVVLYAETGHQVSLRLSIHDVILLYQFLNNICKNWYWFKITSIWGYYDALYGIGVFNVFRSWNYC